MSLRTRSVVARPSFAFAIYAALSCVATWPLVRHLGTQLPLDLGDPLLNAWILSWDWSRLLQLARGEVAGLLLFWHAGIFYPHPLALAYSEHLFTQALTGLPVFAATGNAILGYNVVFLSTFALSGLGAFLLVRQVTGSAGAAFVGGLLYAFAPYRLAQVGHLQVMSSQWMPFVLFGLARWFENFGGVARRVEPVTPTRRSLPLWGAAAALVAQNLSCGYYLYFFAPFAAAYALWEIHRRSIWQSRAMWASLAEAALVVCSLTLPFLLPYLELRQHGFHPRPVAEIERYSADVYSYLHPVQESLWSGWLTDYGREEGVLFPGVVPIALGIVALASAARRSRREAAGVGGASGWRRPLAAAAAGLCVAALALLLFDLLAGGTIQQVRRLSLPLASAGDVLGVALVSAAGWLACSPRARSTAALAARNHATFFAAMTVAAAWLSFGPHVTTKGFWVAERSIYWWLYDYVPGFNGLRVAARMAMIVSLALALLGGIGAAIVLRTNRRWARPLVAALCVFFLAESVTLPMPLAALEWRIVDDSGRRKPLKAKELEPLYDLVRGLPAGTVVAEFPVGGTFDDVRAAYFSVRHGQRLVNGYSGELPPSYRRLREILERPASDPAASWSALVASGATCIVLHEWAFEGAGGRDVRGWLESHGATLLGTFGQSRVYGMPGSRY